MVEGLDMTLEELIQKNKKSKRQEDGNSGSHGSFTIPSRRGRDDRQSHSVHDNENRAPVTARLFMDRLECIGATGPPNCMLPPPPPPPPPPLPPSPSPPRSLEHQMQGTAIGKKLYVFNLRYDVTESDMKVLFSAVGPLTHCLIHCDKSGKSKGTAEVVFVQRTDALRAFRKYNGLHLDGRKLRIEVGKDYISSTSNLPAVEIPPAGTSRPKERYAPSAPCDVVENDRGRYAPSAPCDVVENFREACARYTPPMAEDTVGNGAGGYGMYAPFPMGSLVGNLTAAYGSGASWMTDDINQFQTRHFGRPGPLSADWNQRKFAERGVGSSLVHAHESKQKKYRNEKMSAEALDADLDKYLQKAKRN